MTPNRAASRLRQRALGSYYTPYVVAQALTTWAIRAATDTVLDPSFGGCAFFSAAIARLKTLGSPDPFSQLGGFDVDISARSYVKALPGYRSRGGKIHIGCDFLSATPRDKNGDFSTVAGNPPYIRHHVLSKPQLEIAQSAVSAIGFPVPKTSSYWPYFVLHSLAFLRPGGRLAMVLPFAAVNADYARTVHTALESHFARTTFIYLRERVFNDAQEGSVILLAEGLGKKHKSVRFASAPNVRTLQKICARRYQIRKQSGANSRIACLGSTEKVLNRLSRRSDVHQLGDLASIKIGVVTGDNSFFVLSSRRAKKLQIAGRYLSPILTRGPELRSLILSAKESRELFSDERGSFLFVPPVRTTSKAVVKYLNGTHAKRAQRRYKARIRHPWYRVTDLRTPDAFLTYVNGLVPKLVVNASGVLCTNAIHRLFWKRDKIKNKAKLIALSFASTLGALSAELQGRSYGGGVLKLEPGPARRLLVALPLLDQKKVTHAFKSAVRLATEGKWKDVRRTADELILKKGIKMSREELIQLRRVLTRVRALRMPR